MAKCNQLTRLAFKGLITRKDIKKLTTKAVKVVSKSSKFTAAAMSIIVSGNCSEDTLLTISSEHTSAEADCDLERRRMRAANEQKTITTAHASTVWSLSPCPGYTSERSESSSSNRLIITLCVWCKNSPEMRESVRWKTFSRSHTNEWSNDRWRRYEHPMYTLQLHVRTGV